MKYTTVLFVYNFFFIFPWLTHMHGVFERADMKLPVGKRFGVHAITGGRGVACL